jgi:hypothetical protein
MATPGRNLTTEELDMVTIRNDANSMLLESRRGLETAPKGDPGVTSGSTPSLSSEGSLANCEGPSARGTGSSVVRNALSGIQNALQPLKGVSGEVLPFLEAYTHYMSTGRVYNPAGGQDALKPAKTEINDETQHNLAELMRGQNDLNGKLEAVSNKLDGYDKKNQELLKVLKPAVLDEHATQEEIEKHLKDTDASTLTVPTVGNKASRDKTAPGEDDSIFKTENKAGKEEIVRDRPAEEEKE